MDDSSFTSDEPPAPEKTAPVVQTQPPPDRESTRRYLAFGLFLLLAIFALAGEFSYIKGALTTEELKELNIFFSPIVGLAGAAFGFFFGESRK